MCGNNSHILRCLRIGQPHGEMPDVTATGFPLGSVCKPFSAQDAVCQIAGYQLPAHSADIGKIVPGLIVTLVLDAHDGVSVRADREDDVQDVLQPIVSVKKLSRELVQLFNGATIVHEVSSELRHTTGGVQVVRLVDVTQERDAVHIGEIEPAGILPCAQQVVPHIGVTVYAVQGNAVIKE